MGILRLYGKLIESRILSENMIVVPSVLIAWLKSIRIHGKKGFR